MTLPTLLQEVIPDFNNIPTLHLRLRHSDYIDNIPPEDMNHPIMKGLDFYKRPFLALKLYPRELVYYVEIQKKRNYQSCLSLVTLSKNQYLPVDIARLVETYLDYGSLEELQNVSFLRDQHTKNEPTKTYRHTKRYRTAVEYISNQASVHTIFKRYTDSDKYVHGENYHLSDTIYHWKLLEIDVCVLFSHRWNKNTCNDPEKTFKQLFEGTHPLAVLYNDQVTKTLQPIAYP